MGWNVREVHQEQVQVGTARQAAYVQQETIINHADNHPMWNADKHVLLTTTSVFIKYEYLVYLLLHFVNSDGIANFKLIVYELPWMQLSTVVDKHIIKRMRLVCDKLLCEYRECGFKNHTCTRTKRFNLAFLVYSLSPYWLENHSGIITEILNLPVKAKNDGSFAQARTPNQIQEWPPTGAVSSGFYLTLVIFCEFCHYGIWVHG